MRIILKESEWMSSGLSVARWTGGARIDGHVYQLVRKYMVLVRFDYRRFVRSLGVDCLQKADKRYGTGHKSLRILRRLHHIVLTIKTQNKQNYAHRKDNAPAEA